MEIRDRPRQHQGLQSAPKDAKVAPGPSTRASSRSMAEHITPRPDDSTGDPLTDPLGETVASAKLGGVETQRLRSNVKGALFGDPSPVRIGRYRLVDKLGEGGMGVVYRAHDDELDRDVAIKLLRPDGGGTSKRLLREARSMARLSHPHIAAVYDVGIHDDAVYIALEYIEGPSLRVWLQQPRTFVEIRDVLLQAAHGLHAAHEADVVHRDFKPDNVIVGLDGRVRVLDFGLAKLSVRELTMSSDPSMTKAGSMMGTPRYMAPEQLRQRPAGPGADQFAFCVTLYEAAFGSPPFAGDVFAEVAASVLSGGPTAPPSDAKAPAELWPLLLRGLAREPEHRFESMLALADALEAIELKHASAGVVSRPALRDARDNAREQLGGAFADSLLDADELDERLERLENARTPDTVGELVADLQPEAAQPTQEPSPASPVATEPARNLPAVVEPPATSQLTAIFSGTKRTGHWQPARRNKITVLCGGVDLDFRDVELPPGETIVELQVILGGVDIIVPTGVRVILETNAVMGGVEQDDPSQPVASDAPILRFTGFLFLGGIEVHERLSGEGRIAAWRRRRATKKTLRAAKKAKQKLLPPGED